MDLLAAVANAHESAICVQHVSEKGTKAAAENVREWREAMRLLICRRRRRNAAHVGGMAERVVVRLVRRLICVRKSAPLAKGKVA